MFLLHHHLEGEESLLHSLRYKIISISILNRKLMLTLIFINLTYHAWKQEVNCEFVVCLFICPLFLLVYCTISLITAKWYFNRSSISCSDFISGSFNVNFLKKKKIWLYNGITLSVSWWLASVNFSLFMKTWLKLIQSFWNFNKWFLET